MYTIPDNYKSELIEYRQQVNNALKGKIDPVKFKIFRVVHGIYEQRKKGTFMIRVRCAGGYITPRQLKEISKVAKLYDSEFLHITTRQELQLHNIPLDKTPDILDNLYDIGLSTKGSGGNTVRNITTSIESGISTDDVFDVFPYSIDLTNFVLNKPGAFELPRKLKIAFSSSLKDTALATFNDIGFIAQLNNKKRGFKVYIGGSPSVKPMVGHLLFEFLPENEIFGVTLSIIELFNRFGNRKNRHQARLRYLFYKYGKEKVFANFFEIYNRYRNCTIPNFSIHPDTKPIKLKLIPEFSKTSGFITWKSRYCTIQRQKDLYSITLPVFHGNISTEKVEILAKFLQPFGEDTIRFSRRQNIHLRNIHSDNLGNIYNFLINQGFDVDQPLVLGNLVCCTGADTCQLGICYSKGGLKAIYDKISDNNNLEQLNDLQINLSGCPNSCGQHLVADLGFAGRISKNERIYPSYTVFAGSSTDNHCPSLPEKLGEIAAKDLPTFTNDILNLYANKKKGTSYTFKRFVRNERKGIQEIFLKYSKIPSFENDNSYYIDWGNNVLFSVKERGGGECSAGLTDLINAQINTIKKCKDTIGSQRESNQLSVLLIEVVFAASKLLALSFHKQNIQDTEVYTSVREFFIERGILDKKFEGIIKAANDGNLPLMETFEELVLSFSQKAIQYYMSLDDNLQIMNKIKEITAVELKKLFDANENIQLVDVRESWEKELADIGGQLIPIGTLEDKISEISSDKKTIVYCRSGRRSAQAIEKIKGLCNISNIYNLKGGILAWADEIDKKIKKY